MRRGSMERVLRVMASEARPQYAGSSCGGTAVQRRRRPQIGYRQVDEGWTQIGWPVPLPLLFQFCHHSLQLHPNFFELCPPSLHILPPTPFFPPKLTCVRNCSMSLKKLFMVPAARASANT